MSEIACPVCGKMFAPRPNQLSCSTTCRRMRHYRLDPQKFRARAKEWRQKNIDERRRKGREKYYANYEAMTAYARSYKKKRKQDQPWLSPVAVAKTRAKKENKEFDLTVDWARLRWRGRCELTNIEFNMSPTKRGPHPYAPSVDRIDSSKGYLQSNCRVILMAVNSLKLSGTDVDMYRIAAALLQPVFTMHHQQHVGATLSLPG